MRPDQTPWTPAYLQKLAAVFFADKKPSIADMATAMNRTPHATWTFISRIGMATPGAQVRPCMPCMPCGRKFHSSWIGNRICTWCAESEQMKCAG